MHQSSMIRLMLVPGVYMPDLRVPASWRVPIVLILLCLPVALGGCGNNPYTKEAASGSVLYQTIPDDPVTMDPSVCYVVTGAWIVDLIYPSYYRYHYLKRDPFVLELNFGAEEPVRKSFSYTAVENGRKVAKKGESWTFRIRKGLRFQDDPCFEGGRGREILASDFIYSFRRMCDPAVPCPILSFIEDKVLGLHDYVVYNRNRAEEGLAADYARPVKGLELDPDDPYVFRVLMDRPYPQLKYLMAMHFTTPIPREAVEYYGADFARHPVGSGPYLMEEYSPRLQIVLTKNPNRNFEVYPSEGMPGDREAGLLDDAGKQLPLSDKVVFRILREAFSTWNLFLQGYLDWGGKGTDFAASSVTQVTTKQGMLTQAMIDKGVSLERSPNPVVWYYSFNMEDPVVGGYTPERKKLRQAISLAFDSQVFIDLNLQGDGTPAQFIIPPCIPDSDPDYRNPYRQHNVEKAKKLLAEAGYPGGISSETGERLTIYFDNYYTGAGGRQQLGLISKMFDSIGVNMESRSNRYSVWYEKIKKHEYQFALQGWVADYPDPENFTFLLYGPNADNMGPNDIVYRNEEYDRLFEKMQTMDPGPERRDVLRKMRDIAVEDCPCVYIYYDDTVLLYNGWMSNVKAHAVANDYAKYYRVDGPKRARMQAEWNRPNYWPLAAVAALFVAGILPAVAVVRRRRNRRIRVRHGGGS